MTHPPRTLRYPDWLCVIPSTWTRMNPMSHTPLLAELDPFAREIADAGGMSYEQALVYLQQVSTEMPYSLFEAVIAHKAEPKRVDLQSLLTEIFGEAADQFTTHTVTAEPSEYMNY